MEAASVLSLDDAWKEGRGSFRNEFNLGTTSVPLVGCSGPSAGCRQIDNSELLKHAKLVKSIPALGQFALLDPNEDHSVASTEFLAQRNA
jgi:hypothetical protein